MSQQLCIGSYPGSQAHGFGDAKSKDIVSGLRKLPTYRRVSPKVGMLFGE